MPTSKKSESKTEARDKAVKAAPKARDSVKKETEKPVAPSKKAEPKKDKDSATSKKAAVSGAKTSEARKATESKASARKTEAKKAEEKKPQAEKPETEALKKASDKKPTDDTAKKSAEKKPEPTKPEPEKQDARKPEPTKPEPEKQDARKPEPAKAETKITEGKADEKPVTKTETRPAEKEPEPKPDKNTEADTDLKAENKALTRSTSESAVVIKPEPKAVEERKRVTKPLKPVINEAKDEDEEGEEKPKFVGLHTSLFRRNGRVSKRTYRLEMDELKKAVDSKTDDVSQMTIEQMTAYEANTRVMTARIEEETFVHGWRLIAGYVGLFLVMIGAIMLFSLITLFNVKSGTDFYTGTARGVAYLDSYVEQSRFWWIIAAPGGAAMIIGLFAYLILIYRRKVGNLKGVEDAVLVFTVWFLAILLNATPFLLARFVEPTLKFNFTQAFFESMSGLSTTGLSVMNTDQLPDILLFHRSLTNFIGGVGLVLILTSVVSAKSGQSIYALEGHSDQLIPNMNKSARMIFTIYSVYVLIGTFALMACGLSPLDASCFAMAALATGGLASHSESTAWFEMHADKLRYGAASAISAEWVLIVLMLLGATNFLIHFYLWHAKFSKAAHHFEFAVFFFVLFFLYPIMGIALRYAYDGLQVFPTSLGFHENAWLTGFRHAAFELSSGLSTTGFTLLDPVNFPESFSNLSTLAFLIYIVCMASGGQAGSTSGGLKQNRVAIFFLNMKWNIQKAVDKKGLVKSHKAYRLGEATVISNDDIKESSNYFGLYFGFAILSTLALALFYRRNVLTGDVCRFSDLNVNGITSYHDTRVYTLGNCFFDSINCLSGVGSSCGITGYANATGQWGVLWIEIIGMFVGRLEVTIFLTSFIRTFRLFKSRKNVAPKEALN